MSKNYVGPNTRGDAKRSDKKEIRIASHTPVLKFVIESIRPSIVIEHGMGVSSTPLMHSFSCVKKIVSLEDEKKWRHCKICENKPNPLVEHHIISYSELTDEMLTEDDTTVVFLDGKDTQRLVLLERSMKAGVKAIVEHDVETFSPDRVEMIVKLGNEHSYELHQYVRENPESGLYVLETQNLIVSEEDYVKFGRSF